MEISLIWYSCTKQPSGGFSQSQCLRGLSSSIQPVQVQSSTGGPRIFKSSIYIIRFKWKSWTEKLIKNWFLKRHLSSKSSKLVLVISSMFFFMDQFPSLRSFVDKKLEILFKDYMGLIFSMSNFFINITSQGKKLVCEKNIYLK